jgi:hypothetical protein
MNFFTWLRAYLVLMVAHTGGKLARRHAKTAVGIFEGLVKSDPTNETYRKELREAQAIEAQARTTQAAVNIERDRLDTFRR